MHTCSSTWRENHLIKQVLRSFLARIRFSQWSVVFSRASYRWSLFSTSALEPVKHYWKEMGKRMKIEKVLNHFKYIHCVDGGAAPFAVSYVLLHCVRVCLCGSATTCGRCVSAVDGRYGVQIDSDDGQLCAWALSMNVIRKGTGKNVVLRRITDWME